MSAKIKKYAKILIALILLIMLCSGGIYIDEDIALILVGFICCPVVVYIVGIAKG